MRTIEQQLMHYSKSHQNKVNVAIHAIAVPGIYFVTLGLIYAIPVPLLFTDVNVTWAHWLKRLNIGY